MTTRSGDEMARSADGDLPFGGRYTAAVEAAVQKLALRARAKGLDPDQIKDLIDTLPYASMLEETAKEIYAELLGGVPSLIASLDDGEREIADSLTEVWGPADRLYRAFIYAAYELGAVISQASTRPTPTIEALLGLHPRAVRVAAEVRHLAMGGFAVALAALVVPARAI